MSRRRYIVPLIWLSATLLAAGWTFLAPPLAPKSGAQGVVYVIHHSPWSAAEVLAPFAVFTGAYLIIDTWLALAYRRWLAWAQLVLVLLGAAGIYGVPEIVNRVIIRGATVEDVVRAYKVSAPFETAGSFAVWAGFLCFVAVLISVVIRAWTRPRPN